VVVVVVAALVPPTRGLHPRARTTRSRTTTSRSEPRPAPADAPPLSHLIAVERYLPRYRYEQAEVSRWAAAWLEEAGDAALRRLLRVYESAAVERRASVVPIEEAFAGGDLESRNDRYREIAREAAIDVTRRALDSAGLTPGDIDLIVSVSCTGFSIPAVDAYVADALGMGPRLARLPITESGCAGGVVGLARASEYLAAHPERAALVLAIEFSSLTFQRWDRSATNVVSAAIFGDGGAAVVLVGARHPRASGRRLAALTAAEGVFFPGTTYMMGFRLRNPGLQIVLDRDLAPFVRREVEGAVESFLGPLGLRREDVARWVFHPGGRRVIEEIVSALRLAPAVLEPTRRVLAEHGNMSSVTVLFVLDEMLRIQPPAAGDLGVLGAFGPGFGAELALLRFA
jgi:alkylresorcinol/alkylpyrone synthase